MTDEENKLLTEDLCGRLPYYDFMVRWNGEDYNIINIGFGRVGVLKPFMSYTEGNPLIEEVRPYLRPIKSMTEDEREEWVDLFIEPVAAIDLISEKDRETRAPILFAESHGKFIRFLNEHFLDYNDLIGKGLAIEAPEDMYIRFKQQNTKDDENN